MTEKAKLLMLTAGLILGAATLARAETQQRHCAPRDQVVERLASKFGETRQSIGLGSNNAVMEVFASSKTGTWTITVTLATGITCLVATGKHFEAMEPEPEGDKV